MPLNKLVILGGTPREKFLLLFQQHNEHRVVFVYVVELLCFCLFQQIKFVFLSLLVLLAVRHRGGCLICRKKSGLSNFELTRIPILLFTLSHNHLREGGAAAVLAIII